MRILPDKYHKAYKLIREDAGQDPVLVFVSTAECDSVSALKILLQIFDSDSICYSVFPVSGYEDLQSKCDKATAETDGKRAIVLVNCGGTEDVNELLNLKAEHRVYVIDSHRPLNLANAHAGNEKVLVFTDEAEEREQEYPEAEGASDSDSDSGMSDSDEEEEEDEEGDENEPPSQRQRTGEGGERAPPKRATHRQRRLARKEKARARFEYYNRGAYFGKAAGCLMYDIGHQLSKDGGEALWLAIVSLTDQYVHQRVTQERYTAGVFELEQRVNALNSSTGEGESTVQLEGGAEVKLDEHMRIKAEEEFRFMLLRHWSLYEAMLHSPYIAAVLRTWKDAGRKNLELLLAKIGLPLAQCRQKFTHMKPHLKEQMTQKMCDIAPQFGLADIKFWTFRRLHGYKHHISASDVVYGVTALLEDPENDDVHASFWRALSALSYGGWSHLMHGVDLSMRLQRIIIEQGGLSLAKKSVISGNRFRSLNMGESGFSDSHNLLSHPLALCKLGAFIMDANRHLGNSSKPTVIVAPSKDAMALVVGVTSRPRAEDGKGNRFGLSFRRVAEEISAEFRHDGFDTAVIEVNKSDVQRFLDKLQSDLDAC
mmetsp:Transcript_32116/g.102290  ORF Transcript_32116/g.102290 Transcript_32116/m.102290 type:complete len:597 (+) Transcript_32116:270-2060(+)|eukprot:CAMPEP_0182855460 /NCGR_PEP_ID=MMETSP0034_2-20130328/1855_1 /TAXON_ID=156128 /ORGANISM="Nephroselmis pyriformis, Strain CCMP717" /LENGTH=596 /DNA_ID=CAMNT_0024986423 /DNA_START=234 /DNA_END=2024 /DNA_ORIENTATION=+